MDHIIVNKKIYLIKNIAEVSESVLKIDFIDPVPKTYGDIKLCTSGGYLCKEFIGYTTVYSVDGSTVYLSNDGSTYTPPAPPAPPVPSTPTTPYVPTLDELKASKKREVAIACEQVIYKGVDVTLSDKSVGHFSLTEKDQLNLFGKQAQIAAGTTRLEYHADGQPCRYFTPEDMSKIVQEAMWHVSYHTTYCNALNMWIAGATASSDLQAITYGADVPVAYQSDVLKAYLKDLMGVANAPA